MANINNFTLSIDIHIIPLLTIAKAMEENTCIGLIVNNSPKSMNCLMDNDDGLNCE